MCSNGGVINEPNEKILCEHHLLPFDPFSNLKFTFLNRKKKAYIPIICASIMRQIITRSYFGIQSNKYQY